MKQNSGSCKTWCKVQLGKWLLVIAQALTILQHRCSQSLLLNVTQTVAFSTKSTLCTVRSDKNKFDVRLGTQLNTGCLLPPALPDRWRRPRISSLWVSCNRWNVHGYTSFCLPSGCSIREYRSSWAAPRDNVGMLQQFHNFSLPMDSLRYGESFVREHVSLLQSGPAPPNAIISLWNAHAFGPCCVHRGAHVFCRGGSLFRSVFDVLPEFGAQVCRCRSCICSNSKTRWAKFSESGCRGMLWWMR